MEELMSDKATMLRETNEAFADLREMFYWLTEEQASGVWRCVGRAGNPESHPGAHGPESGLARGSDFADGREYAHST